MTNEGEATNLPATIPPDAFTPERRLKFCAELALSGNVRAGCRRVGIGPQTAYRARHRHAAFALAWDAALVLARDHAEAVLAERALEGIEEAVYYHGEPVATRRRFDGRLLLAHLARLDRRCADADPAQAAGTFDALLAGLVEEAEPGPPEGGGLAPSGERPPPVRDLTREQYIERRAAEAERLAWEEDEDWDEIGPHPVMVAIEEARNAAGSEWDARRAALHARVDELLGE